MLKIFIGPNGYGKTYELEQRRQKLLNEDKDKKKRTEYSVFFKR